MADQPDKSEQTEPASQFKLREARKKGTVFKSIELNSLVMLTVAVILAVSIGESLIIHMFYLGRETFIDAGKVNFDIVPFMSWMESRVSKGLMILSPVFSVLIVVGILSSMLQTGPVFSFFPIKPDIQRINPVAGFKRLFSIKLLFESVKNVIKLLLLAAVTYWTVVGMLPELMSLTNRAPHSYVPFFLKQSIILVVRLLCVLLLMVVFDFLFVRWEYMRNMRMTKKEVKDEYKRHEGDPLIKAKRKELAKELRKRSTSLQNVRDADVVITNPTRLAIVLKYERGVMVAPKVVGKGAGVMAQKIREMAHTHRVPVIENRALARLLFRKSKIDGYIPDGCFVAVAKVYREVYRLKHKTKLFSPTVSNA